MILPDKNIKLSNSLLGFGAMILQKLNKNHTISSLWDQIEKKPNNNFYKFVLALDFLFLLNLIKLQDGIILKTND